MINLKDSIIESLGSSTYTDDYIYRYLGTTLLNHVDTRIFDGVVKRMNMNASNWRTKVVSWMKKEHEPLPKPSEELIPRSKWNIESLVGESERQVMIKDYHTCINEYFKKFKKEHDICVITQCSGKKPYYNNKLYQSLVTKPYGEFIDNASISSPGIVPWPISNLYPFRYDEWNRQSEATEELVDIYHKYILVNMCRFLRFQRKMKYKMIVSYQPHPLRSVIFDTIYEKNIQGARDWLVIALTDEMRQKAKRKYPSLGSLLYSRLPNLPISTQALGKAMIKATEGDPDIKADVAAAYEEQKKRRNIREAEERDDNKYIMHPKLTPTDIMKAFLKHIDGNLKDPSVDKGSNNLYYKSYYFSVLDMIMIALDGDLVEDIDETYWDMVDYCKKHKELVAIGPYEFLWGYKPLLDNDSVDIEDCVKEAYKLKILLDDKTKDDFVIKRFVNNSK